MADLKLRRLDGKQADEQRSVLADLYEEAYAEKLDGAFRSRPAFLDRLAAYVQRPGFELVAADDGGTLVGYVFGFGIAPSGTWWGGFRGELPEHVRRLTEQEKVFAISELMVRPARRRQGIARRLHDALLVSRNEELGTILVDPKNAPARTAYYSWGWEKLGDIQPFDNSPVFESLVKRLS
ncbi:GNAT family N-acetyltransferase [Streptomyces sp. ISL-11]|uniref:GNAT family N-acetyltransferase n=1 Tax=Streptomyces sp. ISL-11 TaxID=2819174 RepID=UPI001BE71A82|nr:GNAT family N-acetyltransferase [Streptomyces sp. ISL-11]MBT2387502.1 GNAT family N-acetyltransferase [Streptomyces sp. ISL-11]